MLYDKSSEEIKRILYTEFLKINMRMRIQRSPETNRKYVECMKFIYSFVEQALVELSSKEQNTKKKWRVNR